MKEVMAIIRMNKMNQTKRALADAGVPAMTARDCLGRGKGLVDLQVLKGAEKGYEEAIEQLGSSGRLIPKRILLVVVEDEQVDTVVKTIIQTNQTKRSGDGVIYVLPCKEVVRVRTGERDDAALDAA